MTKASEMLEARRIAKVMIKDALKAEGQKLSTFTRTEITKAANELIKHDPAILAQAKANLARPPRLYRASN